LQTRTQTHEHEELIFDAKIKIGLSWMKKPGSSLLVAGFLRNMLIDVENLSIERDRFILKDVSWQVQAGERWVILGANGSGKTSLLKALAGYFPPSGGKVQVLGKRFGHYDWNELRKRIGFVSSVIQQRIEDNESAVDVVVSGKYAQEN